VDSALLALTFGNLKLLSGEPGLWVLRSGSYWFAEAFDDFYSIRSQIAGVSSSRRSLPWALLALLASHIKRGAYLRGVLENRSWLVPSWHSQCADSRSRHHLTAGRSGSGGSAASSWRLSLRADITCNLTRHHATSLTGAWDSCYVRLSASGMSDVMVCIQVGSDSLGRTGSASADSIYS
jgi:hypothetical protein